MAIPQASDEFGIYSPEDVIAIVGDFDFDFEELTVVDGRSGKEYKYRLVPYPDNEALPPDMFIPEMLVLPIYSSEE